MNIELKLVREHAWPKSVHHLDSVSIRLPGVPVIGNITNIFILVLSPHPEVAKFSLQTRAPFIVARDDKIKTAQWLLNLAWHANGML